MKDPLEIPIALETPLYTQRVTLDGKDYLLRFDWNGKENRWYMDLGTIDETWIATGIKVIANWPLLRSVVNPDKPAGHLVATDLSPENGEPPSFYDFGRRVKLFYYPV